ncbi:Crp/Fnr family transcriptional regulator [Thalassococcus sp. S3]|uniref:Crp/Fnr family transcriptional regulator n=1 Tax=Thalassococcus sp. S3 TaxID=2017482 RepID=UPI001024609B|nr:Crp/Fnr family transcriptional regulator [Thalassococcus sp. S3]QBF34023.1 Crp/Fnr family transcriptional regulator [Thalassococcus sp. S3]
MFKDPLPKTGFLANASEELVRLLDALASEETLSSGDVLFEQGDEGDALFVITRGQLEFSVLSMDGRKLALDVMKAGALFGEIALFDPGPRTATATALTESRVLRVKYADVLDAIHKTPHLAIDLIRLAGQRMRWMNSQLNDQVFLPLPTRLARKILHLLPDEAQADQPSLKLSQAELADFVGATREAVSKTLATWRRADVVEASRGGLTILDRTTLRAMAELDQI